MPARQQAAARGLEHRMSICGSASTMRAETGPGHVADTVRWPST